MRRFVGGALALGFGWIACVGSIVIDAAFTWWPSRQKVAGPGFPNFVLDFVLQGSFAAMVGGLPASALIFMTAFLRLPPRSPLWRWPSATLAGALIGAAIVFVTIIGFGFQWTALPHFMPIAATAGAATGLFAARIRSCTDDLQEGRASLLTRLRDPILALGAVLITAVGLVTYVWAAQPDLEDEQRLRQSLQFLKTEPCVASVHVERGEITISLYNPTPFCDYRMFLEAARRGNKAYGFEVHGFVLPRGGHASTYKDSPYGCEIRAKHGIASGTGACSIKAAK